MIATAGRAGIMLGVRRGLPPARFSTTAAPAGMGQMAHAAGSRHPVEQQYALPPGSTWDKRSIVLGACRPYHRHHVASIHRAWEFSPLSRTTGSPMIQMAPDGPSGTDLRSVVKLLGRQWLVLMVA